MIDILPKPRVGISGHGFVEAPPLYPKQPWAEMGKILSCAPRSVSENDTKESLTPKHYRFHFYSDEGNEPPHIHIATPDGECKFWLQPIRLARNKGLPPFTIRKIEKLVFENQILLVGKYNESRNK